VDFIILTEDEGGWLAFVNTATNIQVPQFARNFLTG
jgi:hypothetical protein